MSSKMGSRREGLATWCRSHAATKAWSDHEHCFIRAWRCTAFGAGTTIKQGRLRRRGTIWFLITPLYNTKCIQKHFAGKDSWGHVFYYQTHCVPFTKCVLGAFLNIVKFVTQPTCNAIYLVRFLSFWLKLNNSRFLHPEQNLSKSV